MPQCCEIKCDGDGVCKKFEKLDELEVDEVDKVEPYIIWDGDDDGGDDECVQCSKERSAWERKHWEDDVI